MEGLVFERSKLLDEDPLPQCVVAVPGINHQLLSLGGLSVTEIQIKRFKRGCFIHLLICLSILSRNIVTYIKLTTEKLPENSEGDAVKVKVVLNGKRLCQIFSITFNVCLRALC